MEILIASSLEMSPAGRNDDYDDYGDDGDYDYDYDGSDDDYDGYDDYGDYDCDYDGYNDDYDGFRVGYSGQVVDADNFWPWFTPHTFAHRKPGIVKEEEIDCDRSRLHSNDIDIK